MTNKELIEWMDSTGKSSDWLAEKCGVKLSTIASWRSNRPVPSKAVVIIQQLMAADQAAEAEAAQVPQNLVLEFTDKEFTDIENKALAEGQTVRDWAKITLNDAALLNEVISNITALPDKKSFRFPGQVAAGVNCDMWDNSRTLEAQSDLSPDNHIIVEICGDSGGKQYKDGERWLFCTDRKGMTAQDGKAAIFQDPNGQYLKKFNRSKKSLESIDPAFNDVSPLDGMELVGYPVERLKELKP